MIQNKKSECVDVQRTEDLAEKRKVRSSDV